MGHRVYIIVSCVGLSAFRSGGTSFLLLGALHLKAPIFIVGAPRSGTKMLRGAFAVHPDVVIFPSEIDFFWRYGNEHLSTDDLKVEHARPEVIRFIRKRFEALSARNGVSRVLDKTCSNALRLDFVHTVFPEAYIIHLLRDGRAVAESARRRWQARPELSYYLDKIRWVHLSDALYYGPGYLRFHLTNRRLFSKRPTTWGPRFSGIDELVLERSLIEVCGLQWKACVQAAEAALKRLPPDRVITVRYEDLVSDPEAGLQRIFLRVRLTFAPACQDFVAEKIHQGNVKKWRERLSTEDLRLLLPLIQSELLHHGYEL
jgi:hypothetical protein